MQHTQLRGLGLFKTGQELQKEQMKKLQKEQIDAIAGKGASGNLNVRIGAQLGTILGNWISGDKPSGDAEVAAGDIMAQSEAPRDTVSGLVQRQQELLDAGFAEEAMKVGELIVQRQKIEKSLAEANKVNEPKGKEKLSQVTDNEMSGMRDMLMSQDENVATILDDIENGDSISKKAAVGRIYRQAALTVKDIMAEARRKNILLDRQDVERNLGYYLAPPPDKGASVAYDDTFLFGLIGDKGIDTKLLASRLKAAKRDILGQAKAGAEGKPFTPTEPVKATGQGGGVTSVDQLAEQGYTDVQGSIQGAGVPLDPGTPLASVDKERYFTLAKDYEEMGKLIETLSGKRKAKMIIERNKVGKELATLQKIYPNIKQKR